MTNISHTSHTKQRPSLLLIFIGAYDLVALGCLIYLVASAVTWVYQSVGPQLSVLLLHSLTALQHQHGVEFIQRMM